MEGFYPGRNTQYTKSTLSYDVIIVVTACNFNGFDLVLLFATALSHLSPCCRAISNSIYVNETLIRITSVVWPLNVANVLAGNMTQTRYCDKFQEYCSHPIIWPLPNRRRCFQVSFRVHYESICRHLTVWIGKVFHCYDWEFVGRPYF